MWDMDIGIIYGIRVRVHIIYGIRIRVQVVLNVPHLCLQHMYPCTYPGTYEACTYPGTYMPHTYQDTYRDTYAGDTGGAHLACAMESAGRINVGHIYRTIHRQTDRHTHTQTHTHIGVCPFQRGTPH